MEFEQRAHVSSNHDVTSPELNSLELLTSLFVCNKNKTTTSLTEAEHEHTGSRWVLTSSQHRTRGLWRGGTRTERERTSHRRVTNQADECHPQQRWAALENMTSVNHNCWHAHTSTSITTTSPTHCFQNIWGMKSSGVLDQIKFVMCSKSQQN